MTTYDGVFWKADMTRRFDKLLVLDIDETLIFASDRSLSRPADFVGPYHVYKRPHLDTFLKSCLAWFDVGIWTASSIYGICWVC